MQRIGRGGSVTVRLKAKCNGLIEGDISTVCSRANVTVLSRVTCNGLAEREAPRFGRG